ncbi:MAG: aldehyde dehydrogenase [Solirubrobacterales bacterium]
MKLYAEHLRPAATEAIEGDNRLLIGGEMIDSGSGLSFDSIDPATGERLATVPQAGPEDVDAAVRSAAESFRGEWGATSPARREQLLHRFADLLEERAADFALVESLDTGKPVTQIEQIDLTVSVGLLRYYAGFPTKLSGETVPVSAPGVQAFTRREPLGVVAAITPWNFPINQAIYKIAPALAAGCTVVLKPAEQTPLSSLMLGKLALEAGFPPGTINVITGDGATGAALVEHPGVAKIAFTGSGTVGREIARSAASTLKHVSLELGGKNANIVFADADLEAAAATAVLAIFFYSGQVCSAGSRLMVQEEVFDQVLETVAAGASGFQLGPGVDPATTMGPLISREQHSRVEGLVNAAAERGGELIRGSALPDGPFESGYFYQPTVVTGLDDEAEATREEIFGPVLVAQPFSTVEEVVSRVNSGPLGLAAGVWTESNATALQLATALDVGAVWINSYNLFDPAAPWGGWKDSGYGRDAGPESVEKFLQTKTIWNQFA